MGIISSAWYFGIWDAPENCLSAAGTYTSVNGALDMARDLIWEIPDDYENDIQAAKEPLLFDF